MIQRKQTRYTHILIIGNGFDLNQGLKTSYLDFLESPEFISLLNQGNQFVEYLNQKNVNSKNDIKRWIDVENELKIYCTGKPDQEKYKSEKKILTKSLQNYLERITHNVEINSSKDSFKLIEEILKQDYLIFNFNYTDTIYKILLSLGETESEVSHRFVNIHGTLLHDEVIFGVEDGSVQNDYYFLCKGYNINYHENFSIHSLQDRILQCEKVYFFGHSLGVTDHMYFTQFFQNKTRIPINSIPQIFLYHREGREDQLKNKIGDMISGQFTKLKINYRKITES
jgi:Bacteriophage abortive infection AbiH